MNPTFLRNASGFNDFFVCTGNKKETRRFLCLPAETGSAKALDQ
jgi:hypothetical protein